MKTIVLGMGNTIMGDDGIGIYVARLLSERFDEASGVSVDETPLAGMNLLRLLEGFDRAVLVDAIRTSDCVPGKLHKLDIEDFSTTKQFVSPHWTNVYTAMYMGKKYEFDVPDKITVFAVEIEEQNEVTEECSPAIESRKAEIAEEIYQYVINSF